MFRHTPFQRSPKVYEDYFCKQTGHGIPVIVGGHSQRGHGISSFFVGLGRIVLPWLKTGGKDLLKEGLGTCLQIAHDALSGQNVGESMRDRAKETTQRLLHGAVNHLSQSGISAQSKAKSQWRSQERRHTDSFS